MASSILNHPVALVDLTGEHGQRADIARKTAIAIDDIAGALLLLEIDTAQAVLINRIRELAGVIMSAVDDDDTLEGLKHRASVELAHV